MDKESNRPIERVYLLNPPMAEGFVRGGRWQGVRARGKTMYYPIWLAYTAAALVDIGADVTLRDAPAEKRDARQIQKEIVASEPDLVVVETNFSTLSHDLNFVRNFKSTSVEAPRVAVIGPPCMTHTDFIAGFREIDFVVKGESDFAIQDLVNASRANPHSSGAKYRHIDLNGREIIDGYEKHSSASDLDGESFVTSIYKRHLDIRNYFLDHTLWPEVQIMSGRGCPHSCSFCSWPRNLTGREPRLRSAKHVVAEMEFVKKELREVKEVFFEDDTFTLDRRRTEEICELLRATKLDLTWSCQARADIPIETMKRMRSAGCRLLDVGFESASDATLKRIRKGISRKNLEEFANNARRSGLLVLGDFIIGLPGETENDARKTIQFAIDLDLDMVQFAIATPIPGTQLYEQCKEDGFLLTENLEESLDSEGFQRSIVSYPDLTAERIELLVDYGIKRFYFRPGYFARLPRMMIGRNPVGEARRIMNGGLGMMRYLLRANG